MLQRAFLVLMCAVSIAGCADRSSGRYQATYQPAPTGSVRLSSGAGTPLNGAKRAALLLPLTGPRADVGLALQNAARLALSGPGSPLLDVIDTSGTATGAAAAAQAAVTNGDALILGPLTSVETTAVTPVAGSGNIPVLAFTNDGSLAQRGVWTVGITPNQQIRRLVAAAAEQGKTQFAALLPDSDFGRAMATALTQEIAANGLPAPTIRMHAPSMASITSAVRDLSDYANRRGPIDAKVRAARALGTADGRREAQELVKTPIPPPSFNVLLLADTGDDLQEIAALLPYYDVDRSAVQILGPALWSSPSSGAGAVTGAWYAAPDSDARSRFDHDYAAQYGTPPPPIADLAFDAASIARVIITPTGSDLTALTEPAGFVGADGWLAFSPDGKVRRGLAVFRLERAGPAMIEPAPQSAAVPGA